MPTNFTLTSKTRLDAFSDRVSIGDAKKYVIDCTPWQEDNDTIISSTWANDGGNAAVGAPNLVNGVIDCIITFSQAGKTLIGILLTTTTVKKKLWLEVHCTDLQFGLYDDYGMNP